MEDFNVQSAAQKILSAGRLVETETLTAHNEQLDAGDSNALISGDVTAGAVVRGLRSLLVEGSLIGEANRPCRIEAGGDVVVVGEVKHAQLTGRSIHIGGGARDCRLTASRDIEVGGDLTDARIVAGEFDSEKRKIEELKQKIHRAQQEGKFVEQRLKLDQKRMHKQLSTTRFTLDFNIGQIIQRRRNQIRIDLRPFYRVVGEKTDDEIDRALLEFFAKAVVGLMTRTNRHLLRENQNRQKVFKGVIKSLHDLFFLTRKFDNHAHRMAGDEAELNKRIDALSSQTGVVHVQGAVLPGVDLHFVLPDVERLEDGEISIGTWIARLRVRHGADANQRKIVQIDTNGEDSVLNLSPEELQGISIRLHNGQILREQIGISVA